MISLPATLSPGSAALVGRQCADGCPGRVRLSVPDRSARRRRTAPCAAHHPPARDEAVVSATSSSRRSILAGMLLGAALPVGTARAAPETEPLPFLESIGVSGPLALEEEELLELRKVRERVAQQELLQRRQELEAEARASGSAGNALCATPFGIDVVGITELVAFIGAVTGGITARNRKAEVELLNNRLRQINYQLRRQARSGTAYAPGLTYAPNSVTMGISSDPMDPVAERAPIQVPVGISASEEETAEITRTMREGKRFLKEKNGPAAMVRFEKALMLSRQDGDKISKRRAYRGLAAGERIQGQYNAAIKHLFEVLKLSAEIGDNWSGNPDVYGSIADLYTELNDFDEAAKYYDLYISEMRKQGAE